MKFFKNKKHTNEMSVSNLMTLEKNDERDGDQETKQLEKFFIRMPVRWSHLTQTVYIRNVITAFRLWKSTKPQIRVQQTFKMEKLRGVVREFNLLKYNILCVCVCVCVCVSVLQ